MIVNKDAHEESEIYYQSEILLLSFKCVNNAEAAAGGAKKGSKKKGASFQTVSALFRVRC